VDGRCFGQVEDSVYCCCGGHVGVVDAFCSLGRVAPVEERKDGSGGDPREKIK